MPTYDLHQQTFVLSLAVNFAYTQTGSAAEIESYLDKTLAELLVRSDVQALIGDWSLAWGSAVWELPIGSQYSDNTMAVFHNAATNTYVCAIAATNSNSVFDWVVEDAWVGTKLPWSYQPAIPDATISAGTNVGLERLLALRDPATGTALTDFLNSVADTDATLIFAGHSLAGALSPTLALALYGTAQARKAWKQVAVYPTAGATPGNQAFANGFAAQFPQQITGSQPWQKWNTLLWNDLDVVPHAWGVPTMSKLPSLYKCDGLLEAGLFAISCAAILVADPPLFSGTWYSPLTNCALAGTPKQTTIIENPSEFGQEMGYQHVEAYFDLIQVPELAAFYKQASAAPVSATGEPLLNAAPDQASSFTAALAVARKKDAAIKALGIDKVIEAAAAAIG